MLTLKDVLDLIKGVIQFPVAVHELVKLLRDTPQEKHAQLLERIKSESRKFEETGRPTWLS